MGRKTRFILALIPFAICVVVYCANASLVKHPVKQDVTHEDEPAAIDFSKRVPVANNRGRDVSDGYQGEVHPALHRHAELEVTTNWIFNRNQSGNSGFLHGWPSEVNDLFMSLQVSNPTKTYTER